jgi:hypothetical protein
VLQFHQGPFGPLSKYSFCLTTVFDLDGCLLMIIWNFDGDFEKA